MEQKTIKRIVTQTSQEKIIISQAKMTLKELSVEMNTLKNNRITTKHITSSSTIRQNYIISFSQI